MFCILTIFNKWLLTWFVSAPKSMLLFCLFSFSIRLLRFYCFYLEIDHWTPTNDAYFMILVNHFCKSVEDQYLLAHKSSQVKDIFYAIDIKSIQRNSSTFIFKMPMIISASFQEIIVNICHFYRLFRINRWFYLI